MTSPVNHRRRALTVPFPFLTVILSLAASTHSPLAAAFDAPTYRTAESMMVNIDQADLAALGTGLDDVLGTQPVSGHLTNRVEEPFWFGTAAVDGLTYSFRLDHIKLVPEAGRIQAAATVHDLQVTIDRLTLNQSGSRYCDHIPVTSGAPIPVATHIVPTVSGRELQIVSEGTQVALTSTNFQIGEPASCHALFGFDWAIRRILPWTTNLMRGKIAEAVGDAAAATAKQLGQVLTTYLQASVTMPFSVTPAPAFYATVSLWPQRFDLTADHVRFLMGADVAFDPDQPLALYEVSSPVTEALAAVPLPSYLGISRLFFEHLLAEANTKGLFRLELTPTSLPVAADILDVHTLAATLPDAATRFPAAAAVSIASDGARAVFVTADGGSADGIPIIEAHLEDLSLTLKVAGVPYYKLRVDAVLRFVLGYRPATNQIVLQFRDLDAAVADGQFVPGLTPSPTSVLDPAGVAAFSRALNRRLTDSAGTIMALTLPNFAVGSRKLTPLGSSIRDDFVTLDASVR